jgi:CRISPR/Cas system-associated endoribonuclease Cas2
MSRPIFVSFDVTDDRCRDELREVLRAHGDWLQRSLWVLPTSPLGLPAELAAAAARICLPGDRVLVQRPCRSCASRIVTPAKLRPAFGESLLVA